jgi:photosystem II stability/assembly factor-like uncharacterized protein
MYKLFLIISALLVSINVYSQSPGWHELPNAPNLDTTSPLRFDDTYFINSYTGWVIKGGRYYVPEDTGSVYRTTDGGTSWVVVNNQIRNSLRSIGFFDANTGILGTLGDSTRILFRTTDGGFTWTDIMSSIQGTAPRGICGISIAGPNTAYACGRFYGPANVIKTTNRGVSWISLDVGDLAQSLVDCHFFSPDSGFVVGGYGLPYGLGRAVVLFTSNGGLNWTRVHYSARNEFERCWKIFFTSRQVGYTSIEKYTPAQSYYLKTTNGGLNWFDNTFITDYKMQSIAFVNENTGWIGGWGPVSGFNGPTYQTTNGGLNWQLANWGLNVNRFRFISDTLAYAVGETVYKYTREPIGIQPISNQIPGGFDLHQNYPNPFNPGTKIRFDIPKSSFINIKIFDVLGREVTQLVNTHLKPGSYEVNWEASDFSGGIYFYRISSDGFIQTKRMILLK